MRFFVKTRYWPTIGISQHGCFSLFFLEFYPLGWKATVPGLSIVFIQLQLVAFGKMADFLSSPETSRDQRSCDLLSTRSRFFWIFKAGGQSHFGWGRLVGERSSPKLLLMNGRGQSYRLGLSSRQKTVTEQWGHTCCMPELGNAYLMAVLHQTAWAHLLYNPILHSILGRHCTPCFMGHPVYGSVPQSSQGTDCMPSTEQPGHTLHALLYGRAVLLSSLTCILHMGQFSPLLPICFCPLT